MCRKNDKETIEEDCSVTEALHQIVGSDWSELDETVRSTIAKAVQDRFKAELMSGKIETVREVESSRGERKVNERIETKWPLEIPETRKGPSETPSSHTD